MASTLLSFDSNPLLSAVVSFCLLLLLYAPHLLLRLLLSPVIVSATALLAGILHLGSTKKPMQLESSKQTAAFEEDGECGRKKENEKEVVPRPRWRFSDVLVEWNRPAPLEVIYEAEYEGETGDEVAAVDGGRPGYSSPPRERDVPCSLRRYYPESDSDSSSDDGFPAMWELERPDNRCFWWEGDTEDTLIEIPIFKTKDTCRSPVEELEFFLVDDDNLIEIDLSDQKVVKSPSFPAKIEAAAGC